MAGLGFGGAPVGNLFKKVAEPVAVEAVRLAIELGFTRIDTAPHYGTGLSEERIGRALRGIDRSGVTLSTKVGRLLEANPDFRPGQVDPHDFAVPARLRRRWDFTPAGLRRSLESSLERLGLDRVEVLYLHDPDVYDLDAGIRTALPALVRMREEGLVDRVGVGANDADALARCVRESDLDEIMCAGRYSLLDQRAARDLLPLCLERGVDVVAAGVYNSGALATDAMPEAVRFDYGPADEAVVERLRRLHALAADFDVAVPAAAIQFVARHPAVSIVVLGVRTPDQVRTTAERMWAPIPDAFWDALTDSGLLDEAS